jgi:glycosyltransferase involved in cell wall biosynthesis
MLPRFYATSDVFVGPSVTAKGGDAEGFGLVFVEALACSCPVIATDLPAIADIVTPGVNGLIVEQRSSPAIANALLQLLGDRLLLERMKHEARRSAVGRFDWTVISGKYGRIFGLGLTFRSSWLENHTISTAYIRGRIGRKSSGRRMVAHGPSEDGMG